MMKVSLVPVLSLLFASALFAQQTGAPQIKMPLIDSVPPDLFIPPLESGDPGPGKRVRQTLPGWEPNDVYHTLYLPTDYDETKHYPVVVEYAGNGNYENSLGDVSTGFPEGSKLGYGISQGRDAIWVCLPYLNGDGTKIATRWWGDPPEFNVQPTLDYCKRAVPWICETYGGDPNQVILAGFSRGAIACNFIGLHDDQIARLWCGFVVYSHYDGVKRWPYPDSDNESAITRLKRLGNRPQFICHEQTGAMRGLEATRQWLMTTGVQGNFTFRETGFRNHNDAWVLRPSAAREDLRTWFQQF
jgi:hypothetical protein